MAAKFLDQIARYYTAPERIDSLAETLFIMPNKRSGLFLKHYIRQNAGKRPIFMPKFVTMQRLASSVLRCPEADHNELLFMLYDVYLEEFKKAAHQERPTEFDRFIFWGDMILSDYDLIDKSMADPLRLYSNLSDIHDLQADYLTPDQKEIITRIWGASAMTADNESFWFPSGKKLAETEIVRKFVSLWEILGPMYRNLRDRLDKEGLSTPGLLIRRAAELLKKDIPEYLRHRKFVFVGLSDVSTAELSIMERLASKGLATFFWDVELPFYPENKEDNDEGAAVLVNKLARKFPMPADFHLTSPSGKANIDVYGVPSTIGMAKGAAAEIRCMIKDKRLTWKNAIDTAMILPDPSLLSSVMLAMPDSDATFPKPNVTMALPYANTTFATLLRSIILLQNAVRRTRDGRIYYMYDQVLEILQHPHISILVPDKIDLFRQKVIDANKRLIDGRQLADELPELEFIFRPIEDPDSLEATSDYLKNLFYELKHRLTKFAEKYSATSSEEISALEYLSEKIEALEVLIKKYNVAMKESTFLHLFESILNSRPVNLEGTPLSGVQIMGVLETRCIDFDNIIYLSLNEKIFPRRDYVRTMIPNAIRRMYGLPTIQHSESFYSYYFFRSLSRARNITLFYDSRTPGSSNGEMSRFLTRLMYLHGDAKVNHYRTALENVTPTSDPIEIAKTPEVMQRLEEYLAGGNRWLSASSLKNYFHCPLRFYLQNVNSINYEEEPHDYLSAATIGSIFHDTMQFLFSDYENMLITEGVIDQILNHERLIENAFFKSLAAHSDYREGSPAEEMTYEHIVVKSAVTHQVKCLLNAEKKRITAVGPFTYIKGEDALKVQWEIVPSKLSVNFYMIIDRIDRLSVDNYRFIDYKTGTDSVSIGKSILNVFNDTKRAGLLQLMIYAEAYHDTVNKNVKIDVSLININDVVKTGAISNVTFNQGVLRPCPDFPPEFPEYFNAKMLELFDPKTPIRQTDDVENCRFCQFKNICNRPLPQKPDLQSRNTI